MKHKHYDKIVAKAANTGLVVFCKQVTGSKWQEMSQLRHPNFGGTHDYFLCLPQHKEACLHWLNGGDVEYAGDYKSQWFFYTTDEDREWSEESGFNSEGYEFRIKPKKEKRWIAWNPKKDGPDEFSYHTLALIEKVYEGKDVQIIEIEVEV